MTGLKKVESGARAPLGKEEPARKEGRVVGWPTMLTSCSMRLPTGGVDGKLGHGVGKRSRERERDSGGRAHKGKKSSWLALPVKKNEVEFFYVHRKRRVEA
jgi:hypothetical protein